MRLHLLEHDPIDLSDTNITRWAQQKGYRVAQTYLCNAEKLPALADFDWLMLMGGSPHAWEEDVHPWLLPEKVLAHSDQIPETYGLMATLLDNMERQFKMKN